MTIGEALIDSATRRAEVLIATLGDRPAVVTLALDLLLEQGAAIDEVVVVHTAAAQFKIARGLNRIAAEFPGCSAYTAGHISCTYRPLELTLHGRPLDDPQDEIETGAVFTAIYREVQQQKRAGKRVHLSIAGGRKTMSVFGMAAATLLFDAEDRLWHLLSDPAFETQDLMHREKAGDARLVRIPVLGLGSLASPLATLLATDDPVQAVERQQDRLSHEQQAQRREFYEERLTPAEQRVVAEMLRQSLATRGHPSYQDIGRSLHLSPRTVEHHLRAAYKKYQAFLKLSPEVRVDRAALTVFLAPYFSAKFSGKSSPF
ncbi:MAG: hypothetical protein EXR62_16105 [Chloroflexi bacterium]|nr:hypothetical protein [Chloroflexota bacterium]